MKNQRSAQIAALSIISTVRRYCGSNPRTTKTSCSSAAVPKNLPKGTLDLPGGFIDMNETGEEGVAREVLEETGLKVQQAVYQFSLPNIYIYSGFPVHTLDMFFLCTVEDISHFSAMDDVSDSFFLPLSRSIRKILDWILSVEDLKNSYPTDNSLKYNKLRKHIPSILSNILMSFKLTAIKIRHWKIYSTFLHKHPIMKKEITRLICCGYLLRTNYSLPRQVINSLRLTTFIKKGKNFSGKKLCRCPAGTKKAL